MGDKRVISALVEKILASQGLFHVTCYDSAARPAYHTVIQHTLALQLGSKIALVKQVGFYDAMFQQYWEVPLWYSGLQFRVRVGGRGQ